MRNRPHGNRLPLSAGALAALVAFSVFAFPPTANADDEEWSARLRSPRGTLVGTFKIEREEGRFEFDLEAGGLREGNVYSVVLHSDTACGEPIQGGPGATSAELVADAARRIDRNWFVFNAPVMAEVGSVELVNLTRGKSIACGPLRRDDDAPI